MKLQDTEMASVHASERRETRFALAVEIEVSGINTEGQLFRLRTQTRNVSEWGCEFLSPIEMKKDDIIAVRVVAPEGSEATGKTARFQVVRVEQEGGGWAVGTWKMDFDDIWGLEAKKAEKLTEASVEPRKLTETPVEPRKREPEPSEQDGASPRRSRGEQREKS